MQIMREDRPDTDEMIITIKIPYDFLMKCKQSEIAHLIDENQALNIIKDTVILTLGLDRDTFATPETKAKAEGV